MLADTFFMHFFVNYIKVPSSNYSIVKLFLLIKFLIGVYPATYFVIFLKNKNKLLRICNLRWFSIFALLICLICSVFLSYLNFLFKTILKFWN